MVRQLVKRIAAALEADSPIAFSQHWGKMGDITKARFGREFGDPAKVTEEDSNFTPNQMF